jgi:hypothetical protein
MNYIAAKGKNEFGGSTGPELNFDGQVMYDVGTAMGLGKNTFRVGLEYQYWRNKFGNPHTVPGSLAKTDGARRISLLDPIERGKPRPLANQAMC